MSYFPAEHQLSGEKKSQAKSKDVRYYELKKALSDGDTEKIIPCGTPLTGHFASGWHYFTHEGQPHFSVHSKGYPGKHPSDIGLNYDAKFKRQVQYGQHKDPEDLDSPTNVIYFVGYIQSRKDEEEPFAIIRLDRKDTREGFESTLNLSDSFFIKDNGVANFTFNIARKGTGTDTSYQLITTLLPNKTPKKVLDAWNKIKDEWYLPAMYDNANPFAGKPADAKPPGLPHSVRDDYGADVELASSTAKSDKDMPGEWD